MCQFTHSTKSGEFYFGIDSGGVIKSRGSMGGTPSNPAPRLSAHAVHAHHRATEAQVRAHLRLGGLDVGVNRLRRLMRETWPTPGPLQIHPAARNVIFRGHSYTGVQYFCP